MGNIRFGLHREYPPFLICFLWVIVSFYFLVAIFEPFFLMHDPNAVDYTMKFAQPSIQYPFGCDQLGRCVYSRIIQGARISIGYAALVVFISCIWGTFLGIISSYYGGKVDRLIDHVCNLFRAFPEIIVILILAGLGGKNIFFICAGMMIMHWVIYTRVVRELTADGKMKNMVYAARMAGNKTPRIWIKYIFPIAAPAFLSMLALDFAGSLLAMSGYSFLGLGVQPPQADWGTLIGEAQAVFISYPRLIFFPSISILGISLSVNMIGDWIQQRYQAGEM